MRVQHVLFTTDLSEGSMHPAAAVGAFALREEARLTLLHVVESIQGRPHGAPLAPPVIEPGLAKRHEDAESRLQALRDSLPAEIEIATVVMDAQNAPECIDRYVREHDVDLVAMSTHGRTGIRRMALGSIAEGVLRRVHVPVLAFPQSA